jgi:hypothetical protein
MWLCGRRRCQVCGFDTEVADQADSSFVAGGQLIPESLGGPTEEQNLWLGSLRNDSKSNRISALDATCLSCPFRADQC